MAASPPFSVLGRSADPQRRARRRRAAALVVSAAPAFMSLDGWCARRNGNRRGRTVRPNSFLFRRSLRSSSSLLFRECLLCSGPCILCLALAFSAVRRHDWNSAERDVRRTAQVGYWNLEFALRFSVWPNLQRYPAVARPDGTRIVLLAVRGLHTRSRRSAGPELRLMAFVAGVFVVLPHPVTKYSTAWWFLPAARLPTAPYRRGDWCGPSRLHCVDSARGRLRGGSYCWLTPRPSHTSSFMRSVCWEFERRFRLAGEYISPPASATPASLPRRKAEACGFTRTADLMMEGNPCAILTRSRSRVRRRPSVEVAIENR